MSTKLKKNQDNQTKLSLKFQSIGVGTVPTLENEKKKDHIEPPTNKNSS